MHDDSMGPFGHDPHSGYAVATGATATGRDAEAKVFARVIAQLKSAMPRFAAGDVRAMAEAIHLNDRLWIALAVDLLHEDNKLPSNLRRQLLNLAVFSQQHGRKVIQGEANAQPLIDVNAAVMRGLRGQPTVSKDGVAA